MSDTQNTVAVGEKENSCEKIACKSKGYVLG